MAIFIIHVKHAGEPDSESWKETYNKAGIGDNGNLLQIEDWAHQLIERFNATLRPKELPRALVKVELAGSAPKEHNWSKVNLVTVCERGVIFDRMRCTNCGVTGKRYGVNGITIDSKYKAKKYKNCEWAK